MNIDWQFCLANSTVEPLHGMYLNKKYKYMEGLIMKVEPLHGMYLNIYL